MIIKKAIFVQYLYTDFGTMSANQTAFNGTQALGNSFFKQTATLSDNIITVGVNYRISV